MNHVRQQRILDLLQERGSISSKHLADLLGVTAMTVWRDLRELAEMGLIQRIRGGVQSRQAAVRGIAAAPVSDAESERIKQTIARRAVEEFVRPGDMLAIGGGTTVAALVPWLPEEKVSVLTNSIFLASMIRGQRPGVSVLLPGGWLSPLSGDLCGPETVRRLAREESRVCFISAWAYDAERGPLDQNPLEIETKRALVRGARRVVLLLESAKFYREAACITLHPRHLHAVVTEAEPPADVASHFEKLGIRLIVAH